MFRLNIFTRGESLPDAQGPLMACLLDAGSARKAMRQNLRFTNTTSLRWGPDKENITKISDSDKFSAEYQVCIGCVAVGKDKVTGKNISFLSHDTPWKYDPTDEHFVNFRKKLIELKSRCEPGSVEVGAFGGALRIGGSDDTDHTIPDEKYIEAMENLSLLVEPVIGRELMVLSGPRMYKDFNQTTMVGFSTRTRRLFIARNTDQYGIVNESFPAAAARRQINKMRASLHKEGWPTSRGV